VKTKQGFSLLELLVSAAIIAALLAMLLPTLIHARRVSHQALCAHNLRQISIGWLGYVQENKDTFPQYGSVPEWSYGGVMFAGPDRTPMIASERPINRYLADEDSANAMSRSMVALFRCPSDRGVFERGTTVRGSTPQSQLEEGRNCFETFGTSYRANPFILDSTRAGIDALRRPLRLHEIHVDQSRLLLLGDPAWWYATRPGSDADEQLEASWHGLVDAGNMLAVDGSTRFVKFGDRGSSSFTLFPRPVPLTTGFRP
jgi:prepilin-type N-terminal cleavage/methylation domain-containing protein